MEECDQETRVIEAVREHNVLFDKSVTGYSSKTLKNKAWNEVGQKVDLPALECNTMWKKLRQQYFAHQRKLNSPSGSSAKRRPYFRHEDSMKFIQDCSPEENCYSNVDSANGSKSAKEFNDSISDADEEADVGLEKSSKCNSEEHLEGAGTRGKKVSGTEDTRSHRKFANKRKLDPFDQEMVSLLKSGVEDEFKSFGDFIAQKLREINKLDKETCNKLQMEIHVHIFAAMESIKK